MKKFALALFFTVSLGVAHGQQWKKVPSALLHDPSGAMFPNGSGAAPLGYVPPPYILYDSSGNVFPAGSGTPLGYIPPAFTCYTISAGSAVPCNFAAASGVTSVTGTANQIDVATGTTTPVISLDPSLILPAGTTGLPVATGISGLGTGVATALAVNVGSAGAPVVNGGAGGTPSGLVITNATGTCAACTANAVTTIPPLSAINAQTATYQVLAADFSAYKVIPVASGTFTVTLVASGSQPAAGQYIEVINFGTGFVTVARSGQNINGGTTSIILPPSTSAGPSSAKVWSDGTNYFAHTVGATGNGYLTGSAPPTFSAATAGLAGLYTNTASADIYTQGASGAQIGQVRLFGLTGSNGASTGLASFSSTLDTLFAPAINGNTKFTTSGCSVSSTTGNGTAGIFTLGANSCTVIITLNGGSFTAPNGWICEAHDRTATTIFLGGEASSTTTTCSIAIPVTAGATDVIAFTARPY